MHPSISVRPGHLIGAGYYVRFCTNRLDWDDLQLAGRSDQCNRLPPATPDDCHFPLWSALGGSRFLAEIGRLTRQHGSPGLLFEIVNQMAQGSCVR